MIDTITLLISDTEQRKVDGGVLRVPEFYKGTEIEIADHDQLCSALTELESRPTCCVVRGGIRAGVDRERMRRAHKTDPTLEERPHHWLMLDLDEYEPGVPAQDFAADVAGWAARARSALPACFSDARAWYQATGSAGIKPGVRLRLAFWLSSPWTNSALKGWIKGWKVPVDLSLYTPSQPHYIARPRFSSMEDPVKGPRSGVLPGRPYVEAGEKVSGAGADLTGAIVSSARKLARTPEGSRRNALNALVFALARLPGAEDQEPEITASMLDAATASGLPGEEAARTIALALADGKEAGQAQRAGWRADLSLTDEGTPRSTAANTTLFLFHHEHWKRRWAFDTRALEPVWSETGQPVTESDIVRIREWFQSQAGIQAHSSWVQEGMLRCAKEHETDGIGDYLSALPPWDGTFRVPTFFCRHWGVEDTALTRRQSVIWFLQAVLRAGATLDSPVKADYMIVLIARQGTRKSSGISTLCPSPRYFTDRLPDIRDKDSMLVMAKCWIIEMAEMIHRVSDRDAYKAFLTAQVDTFRAPYAARVQAFPRRCVLIGTTNEEKFLEDPTGSRRFWPMLAIGTADLKAIASERDQLWSEATEYARAGVLPYLTADEEALARMVQDGHTEHDPIEDVLEPLLRCANNSYVTPEWLPWQKTKEEGYVLSIKSAQVLSLLGLDIRDKRSAGRVRDSLLRLGWRRRHAHGQRVWEPSADWRYEKRAVRVGAN